LNLGVFHQTFLFFLQEQSFQFLDFVQKHIGIVPLNFFMAKSFLAFFAIGEPWSQRAVISNEHIL
jgi:hypothetical protein